MDSSGDELEGDQVAALRAKHRQSVHKIKTSQAQNRRPINARLAALPSPDPAVSLGDVVGEGGYGKVHKGMHTRFPDSIPIDSHSFVTR